MRKVLLIMTLLLTMVAQGAWADGTIDITPSDKNKVLCTDGSIYNNVSAAEAASKTPVAKIIVVDTENHKGLALALWDEGGYMQYSAAKTARDNKNTSTPVTNATWAIPSQDEWDQMITAAGGRVALRNGFEGIGGSNLSTISLDGYWSTTKDPAFNNSPTAAYFTYVFGDMSSGWLSYGEYNDDIVRARLCLQFNLPIPTHNATLATGTPTGWSITPTTPEEGSTVTVSYTGQHRVKSVKVKSAAPAGPKAAKDATAEDLGKVIGADGYIYADADAATAANTTAVAKIAYVGSDNGEADPYNHGLALALSDANDGSKCNWKTERTDAGHTKQTSSTFTEESGLQYNATHNSGTYPAFQAAIANNGTAAPTGCSSWFLASGYQWDKMANAAGSYANLQTTAPPYTGLQTDWYWSSTEFDANWAWDFNPWSASWAPDPKDGEYRVRACLAF